MSLPRRQATFILAFLALMFAQAFGLERGYASHHGISVIERDFEAVSHATPSAVFLCLRTHDGHRLPENHAPMTVDMETGRDHAASAVTLAFVPVQVAETSLHEWISLQQQSTARLLSRAAASGTAHAAALPAAVQVARHVVFLL